MPETPRPWREAWRERLSGGWVIFTIAFRSAPVDVSVALVISVMQMSLGQLNALALKWLTDGVVLRDTSTGWRGILVLGALLAVSSVSTVAAFPARMRVREHTSHAIDQELMRLAGNAPTLEHFERPQYADRLELLRASRTQLGAIPDMVTFNLASIAQVVTGMAVLSTVHPALAVLPLFGLPALVVSRKSVVARERLNERYAENARTRGHLFRVVMSPISGKELRIFGLGPTVIRRRQDLWHANDRRVVGLEIRWNALAAASWSIFAAAYIAGITLVTNDAIAGRATPGDVVLAIMLASQVRGYVQQLYSMVNQTSSVLISAERYTWLRAHARGAIDTSRPLRRATVPATLRGGITFDDASFRYPGTDVDVLEHIDIELPAGSTVALVGDNGAGKTTLVKLLARYYDPSGGRILVDGEDLRDFDPGEWRTRLSAGFQDFAKLEVQAREGVGVGDLPRIDDLAAVRAALGRAAADELERDLPSGLSTLVGRSFEGGVELSGGQWQKLALGRALMREDPLLLLLDEPTANLDAQTEHALFERYAGAARRASARNGAITVLVSHRFSTVRMADLIVVLDGSRVHESGSHGELMARGGIYAELYELQARAYRP